jgi:hypothetical protein
MSLAEHREMIIIFESVTRTSRKLGPNVLPGVRVLHWLSEFGSEASEG